MGFEKVYITKDGSLLAAKTLQGKKVEFDHAEIGSGTLTGNARDKKALTTKVLECSLNNIKICNEDFEKSVKTAKKGDFVYFDPPYDSDTSTFNSYTEEGFGKEEQKRLAKVFKELDKKGVYVMLSNHNTVLVNELYKDYNIHVIEAKRNINSNGKKRGKVEEVIITNYNNTL